jgi:hypothetical protein
LPNLFLEIILMAIWVCATGLKQVDINQNP